MRMIMKDGPVLAFFSLSEDEQESLDPFWPSYWKALQAGSDVLEHERQLIWHHWEATHPHLFLALSGYRRSLKHVKFAKENKMEKIEAYLRRIGFLTDGVVPPNPFTIAQQALQNLVTYLESQENGSTSLTAQPTMGSQSVFNQVVQPTTFASTTLRHSTHTHVPRCLPDAGVVDTPSIVQDSPRTPPSAGHMDTFLVKRRKPPPTRMYSSRHRERSSLPSESPLDASPSPRKVTRQGVLPFMMKKKLVAWMQHHTMPVE
ncbi:hypothetical protein EDD18DRAFT_1102677 [Armillaria luteobubalina]|uniref:Uncharacterized protein n=1 Tax=Armillaria luteobubalina TaxID=153913 RepID=A0AA39QB84_9AGAR|nr:hypothetical protein EDD18DRAFT_1102677 [Armillaria luteobubalina]